ncbi:hypothetical protein [Zymomonas mobilis]|uniref:hypothetical protein n=1 Tax=Zymomonas mobilis TaxID=542 RepID=UPI0039EA0B11
MKQELTIDFFIRFFSEERYANAFINGYLWLNTLEYFKGVEQSDGRGDPYEGVTHWFQPKDIGSFKIEASNGMSIDMVGSDFSAPLMMQNSYIDKTNIFCLYAYGKYLLPKIDYKATEWSDYESMAYELFKIDEGCRDFGDWAVVIQPKPFIEKIIRNFNFSNKKYRFGLVNYYDDSNFSGNFPIIDAPFNKQKRFEYQREFRICVYPDEPNFHIPRPLQLNIGDLSSCTYKTTTDNIMNNFFKIDLKPK